MCHLYQSYCTSVRACMPENMDHGCTMSKTSWNYYKYYNRFFGPLSGTTRERWYQNDIPFWIFAEAEMMGWQWHQLDHNMQTDKHASQHLITCFYGRMFFLPPNQQCQNTEGLTEVVECFFCKLAQSCNTPEWAK